MNYDPRNIGVSQQKVFLDELAKHRVVRQEIKTTENAERLVLDMERSFTAAGVTVSYASRYEFDTKRNYLPCRIVDYARDDGKILSVMDIEYREVGRNFAWFPKKSTHRFFADAHAETPEQHDWTQQVTLQVGPVRTDETFGDTAFEIEIPLEILRDNTRGRPRPSKPDPQSAGPSAAVLVGRVTNDDGTPLAGARVRIGIPDTDMRFVDPTTPNRQLEIKTDARGDYRLEIPGITEPTRISIDAMKPGFRRLVGTLMDGW
jgi:hypothetical protein